MPKFNVPSRKIEAVTIARNQVFWLVEFFLSPTQLENLPTSIRPWIDGEILYGFYADPLPGDEVEIYGYTFRVSKRKFRPTKRNSKDKKIVGSVEVELLSLAPILPPELLT